MDKYTLADLVAEMATKPKLENRIFIYHTRIGKYGDTAKKAVKQPFWRKKTPAMKAAIATARTHYDTDILNPFTRNSLYESYATGPYTRMKNLQTFGKNAALYSPYVIGGIAACTVAALTKHDEVKIAAGLLGGGMGLYGLYKWGTLAFKHLV
jgi:hypothetical protein